LGVERTLFQEMLALQWFLTFFSVEKCAGVNTGVNKSLFLSAHDLA
jgi:hypothetical protein